MSKLLSANFSGMWKVKIFWIGVAFMAFMGIFMPLMRYNNMRKFETIYSIDGTFFICAIFVGIISAIFCSLFVGTEYSDGTIRNKIIVGHSRITIYFSNLITNVVVGVIFCTVFFILHLCIGLPLLGAFDMELRVVIILTLSVYMLSIALSAIFTLLAMLNQNKTIGAIACILTVLIFLFVGSYINSRLHEPEMILAYTSTNGSPMYDVDTPNPNYLDGTVRQVHEVLYSFLPGGQMIQFASMEFSVPYMLSLYSCIIIIVTTGLGLSLFAKKDLK